MKIILLSLMIGLSTSGFSQGTLITVTAQNKTVSASPDEDNLDKELDLKKSITPSEAYLIAKVSNEEMNEGWKRNLIIYDNEDNEISRLVVMKENTYCASLKSLLPVLQNGKEYSLYTAVLPEDPQKAMEVRVARQLVCKIKISD